MSDTRDGRPSMDWSVVAAAGRALASEARGSHVDAVELDRLDRGELGADAARAIRAHLLGCTPCAIRLSERRPLVVPEDHVSDVVLTCVIRGWIPRSAGGFGLRIGEHVAGCAECAERFVRLRDAVASSHAADFLRGLQLLVAARQMAHARRGRGFSDHRGAESEVIEALVIDPRRTAGETPRTVGFRLRTASLVDGRIHLELASSADDAATLRGYQAEVVVSYDGLRLELPPVPVGTTGVVVVSGPVPALRGMREATVRDIPAESIGLVLLAPDGAAQS